MNIADQIMRRADRAFAEASGRILIEDLSPMERKAIEDDMERKARYVRTPAGVRRFKRPIGAIILPRGGSLDQIRIKDPVFKGFDLVEDRKGNLYDVGKDPASGGKYVVLKHNTWDDQLPPQDSLDKALEALNEKLGGGTNSDREEGEKPAPKAKKPEPKKAPGKESSSDSKPQTSAPSKGNTSTAEIVDGKFVITTPDGKKHTRTATGKKPYTHALIRKNKEGSGSDRYFVNFATDEGKVHRESRIGAADRAHNEIIELPTSGNDAPKTPEPQGDAPASDDNVASSDPRERSAKFKRAADNMDRALDAVDSAKTEDDYRRALTDLEKSTVEMEDYIKSKGSEEDFARSALPKIERAKAKARSQIKRLEAKRKDQAGAGASDKPKAASKGAQGSPERDAFIESHPKIKDVTDYHKPKLRDMSEKNFEAYVAAVEGGKSPNSIGPIMDRIDTGASWNPVTEKWVGQNSTKRPSSPTPTGDTSASDAADAAVRDRVQKMKDADRSKGRTNPHTSSLTESQKASVDNLTPGQYAKYMNRRDAGDGHYKALAEANGQADTDRARLDKIQKTRVTGTPDEKVKKFDDLMKALDHFDKTSESGLGPESRKVRSRIAERRADALKAQGDQRRAEKEASKAQGEPTSSGRQMGAQEKRAHDSSVKDFDKAMNGARNLSQGPDMDSNLRRYTASRDSLERAIREYEVTRPTGYGVSPETERRYADARSLSDTLDNRIKGFREQRAQEQADLKREQEAERQRQQAERAAADERRSSERQARFEAREKDIAQSEKYGNQRQMIESNYEHLRNVVEAGRAGNGESLRAETEERIAEIKKRLALDDRTLGGYGMGKGGAEADRDGAQHRDTLTGQMGSFEQALKIMDRVKSNQEAEQEREERRNRAPVSVPQDFDAQKRVMDKKYEALRKEISDFERTGGTQAWLNKVATVERLTALQKKVRDLRAEADRVLDPKTSTSLSADYSKERFLKDLDHRANLLQISLDRSRASDRAKERARAKAEGASAAPVAQDAPQERPAESSSRGADAAVAQERVKGVDSTVSLAKTQAQKARRARTEKAARDHINTLNSTERDLNRTLERSGDRMPAEQRAEVEQALQEIQTARAKAEKNIPLRDRTHLRPEDLPALREEAESRRYTIANPRVNAAVNLFNEIPSGTDLPNGRRYEQSVDMDDVYAMDNPPSVPELNRAIDALEKEGDGDYDDELWVLRTVRDSMKEKIDRDRAEIEAANTSLFGDDLSIPEPTPARPSARRVTMKDVKWKADPSKERNVVAKHREATVNGHEITLQHLNSGRPGSYFVSVKDPSGKEVYRYSAPTDEETMSEVANRALRHVNGEDPSDARPAGEDDRPATAIEKARQALRDWDRAHAVGSTDPGMQSMRFHETQRQRDKKLSSYLNQMGRESKERQRLVNDIARARREERDAKTPKTPVDPSIIKGSDRVLVLNHGRAEWKRVKRVNKTTVTVDGGGGGMDDPRYPHSKIVGVRKDGEEIIGGATPAPRQSQYTERPGDPGDGPFRRGADRLRRAGVEEFTPNQARQVDEMSRDQWEAAQGRVDAGESISDVLGSTATRNRRDPMAPPSVSRDEVQRRLAERRAAREAASRPRTTRATSSWDSYDESTRPQTDVEVQENGLERERQRADRDARIQREARSAQAEQESYMASLRTRPQFSRGSYNREAVVLALVEGNPIQQVFGRDRQAAQESLRSIVRSFKPTDQERTTAAWGNDQRLTNKVRAYDEGVTALRDIYNIDDPDLQRGASIGDTPAPRATNVPAGQSEDRTSKTAIDIGRFGVRSEAEARQMYANTPRRDIADIPKGGNGHIGNGVWVKRCPVCGQAFKSLGVPGYSSTYAKHVDSHGTGIAIPGYNVGMLS